MAVGAEFTIVDQARQQTARQPMIYAPAWLGVGRRRASPIMVKLKKDFRKMFTKQDTTTPRLDAAQVAAAFRNDLAALIGRAKSDHVRVWMLDDVLESALAQLRKGEASKPR
jgi:hypothetical protein